MSNFDLVIANDHAGVKLKQYIISYLHENYPKLRVKNFGTDTEESVDYPDFTKPVTDALMEKFASRAILICGTGIGMSIAANRNSSIRAALCINSYMAEKARQHNDANILVIGSKLVDEETTISMLEKFLNTEFEGGRHQRRLNKIF